MDEDGSGTGAFESRLVATGFAMLVSSNSAPPLAVVLETSEVPPACVVHDAHRNLTFSRLRRGALAYGLPEAFTEAGGYGDSDNSLVVSAKTHRRSSFERATNIFGAVDTVVYLPVSASGQPYSELSIPVASPLHPTRAIFRLDGSFGAAPHYCFVDSEIDDVWLCPICGRACAEREPHGASHGVPGHYRAGGSGATAANDVHPVSTRFDDPNSPAFVERHRQLAMNIDGVRFRREPN
jgi:hypothetical protein